MKTLLRRIRGAMGIGLTWAGALFAVSFIPWIVLAATGNVDVPFPLGFAAFGFVGGTLFSTVIGLVEGRRSFDQMSLPRFAGWGALGGAVLAGVWVVVGAAAIGGDSTPLQNFSYLGPIFSMLGAGFAGGSLVLARRVADKEVGSGEETLGSITGETLE